MLREATAAKSDYSASQPPCRSTESSPTLFASHIESSPHQFRFPLLRLGFVSHTVIHRLRGSKRSCLSRLLRFIDDSGIVGRPTSFNLVASGVAYLYISLFPSPTAHSTELRAQSLGILGFSPIASASNDRPSPFGPD
ncbi:E3 SUMO-protein ligase [Pseudozyma hubeiensis SY62]|uniref:E3 SUMO-protein ligase n=1 Tax=Pseudozyma hubeiensis (strain SY62) TaxID=1305764 RepID=R9P4S0_PSEHS|nr:E3 SUMO-protein ligase [Pseudozyma hubeiensis SY62]GAC96242.1 E3 SUMO-protein ligase [Pseudozyma hubeiensis SY62]